MTEPAPDLRGPERRARDERIASEPLLAPPHLATAQVPQPVEAILPRRKRPVAVAGVVENGVVRLDPGVVLPERSRVIVVASEG
jgi:uncharacterized membrane protein